jgi:DNA-binding SARP family transcriptional activator/TolB-like protein
MTGSPGFDLDRAVTATSAVPPLLRLTMFGPMSATDAAGRSVLPKSRKARGVLAVLALQPSRPILRSELADLLWSRRDREQARASLRQAIHELTDLLGLIDEHLLRVDRNHLLLAQDMVWVDAHAIVATGATRPELLDLFHANLLGDLAGLDPAFDRWRVAQMERLTRLVRARAEEALKASHGCISKVAAAERLLHVDRAHEGAWRVLIKAHAARGDRAAAIAAFERCADAMADVAQLTPSAETEALLSTIREARAPGGFMSPAVAVAWPFHMRGETRKGRLRIGVMPLRVLGPGAEDELSLGVAEEITTALSRLSWISCITPSAVDAIAGGLSEAGPSWKALDLDFLVQGTVQRGGGRVRVMARLLNMRAGGEALWARRVDRDVTDILTLQDTIAAELVAQLNQELLVRENERVRNRRAGDSTARDLLFGAIPGIYRLETEGFRAAGEMLAAAIALDPGYAAAHAWYSYWHMCLVGQGWAADPGSATDRGAELAERALVLDPSDARALTMVGHVRSFLRRRAEEGLELHERALSLNPQLALARCFSGLSLSYLGRHEEAIVRAEQARLLSPFDPHVFLFDMAAMMPRLMLRQHEIVVEISNRAAVLNPGFSSTYKGLLAALGHLGNSSEAASVRRRLLTLEPGFTVRAAIDRSALTQQADIEHYAEGLRRAGLPE